MKSSPIRVSFALCLVPALLAPGLSGLAAPPQGEPAPPEAARLAAQAWAVPGPFTQLTTGGRAYTTSAGMTGGRTCALTPTGDAQCWGNDVYGHAPSSVAGPFTHLSAGHLLTFALKPGGDAQCWGYMADGAAPQSVIGPFTQVAGRMAHGCEAPAVRRCLLPVPRSLLPAF